MQEIKLKDEHLEKADGTHNQWHSESFKNFLFIIVGHYYQTLMRFLMKFLIELLFIL